MRAAVAVMAMLAVPDPASAAWRTVPGWTIVQAARGCSADTVETYGAAPSTLRIYKFVDGKTGVEIGNPGWSVAENDKKRLYMLIDDHAIETDAFASVDHHLMFPLTADLTQRLANGSTATFFLKVDGNSERALEQFKLRGSRLALQALDQCYADIRARTAAEERRQALIADDPFQTEKR